MEPKQNNFIQVDYELFAPNESGNLELVEKTSTATPFAFISGLGFALVSFEQRIQQYQQNDRFEFTIPVEEAYGEYTKEHVISLPKDLFNVNGKFDETRIYPGNVIPLANEDGNHFDGIVQEVKDDVVVMDLNHPLAGKPLTFRGQVISNRPATTKEIESFINKMSGEDEGCDCCGHHHEGHEGHCHHCHE